MNRRRWRLVTLRMQENLSFEHETDGPAGPRAELHDPTVTVAFMLAGDAHVTFQSRRTGTRFTYHVEQAAESRTPGNPPPHFVSVLDGPDHYSFLGTVFNRTIYAPGKRSHIATDAPSAVAFAWVWKYLSSGRMHPELAIYHEGRCGRCGRRLTTPESIETGLGPVCAQKMGL